MNFVRQIVDELSGGEALGKLSSLLGVDDDTAESAIGAAAPSLLASLASLATQSDGTRKLTNALGSFGESSWGGLGDLLGGDTSSLFQKGGNLLNNLFSASILNGLSNAIGKYAGINSGTAKNLLAYIAPMILGKVAALWRSRGGDTSALTSFFAEQKENIVDAMPAGLSLNEVPGLARFGDVARTATRHAEPVKASAASWLLPLAIVLAGAALLWSFMSTREVAERREAEPARTEAMKPVLPEAPAATMEATQLTDNLRDILDSANTSLAGIEDAASAEAAQPQLEELNRKLDSSVASLGRLPQIAQNSVHQFVTDQIGPIKEHIERIGRLPSLPSQLQTLIVQIVNKFQQLTGEANAAP